MGKGNRMIILSSDDDDDDDDWSALSSSRTGSRSKSRSSCRRGANPRAAKRARLSGSRASKESSHVDEIRLSFEDFDEALSGFEVSSGSARSKTKDLWVNKYRPHMLEDLAVHKKKVEEIRMWLEMRLNFFENEIKNHVLLVTGQSGVGKSATIQAIASSLGVTVCEWNAPIPTIWQEHMHNSSAGLRYISKLDEFENFIERTRKYGLIASSRPRVSKSHVVLLIDDLPLTNGRHAFERLRNCLILLVRSTQIPTVVVITDYEKMDFADQTARSMEELQSSLEREGACKVSFNPITKNSIKKRLQRICKEENCNVTAEDIDQIAGASGGDIRNAIMSLQLFSLKPEHNLQSKYSPRPISTSTYLRDGERKLKAMDERISFHFGRDETLSLFHALGKFLHNKRETDNVIVPGGSEFIVHDQFARLPMRMDAPEKVLYQAHGQARPVVDFLHENVLDFLDDEATDEAGSVTSYLADADLLLASFRGVIARHNETENVLQSAGASVAVRGVLYGNSHPLSSRWHAIRRPKLWQVEQSSMRNRKEMTRDRAMYYKGPRASQVSVTATEYRPRLKWLGVRASETESQKPIGGSGEAGGDEEEESEVSEDEIEDW